MKLLILFIVLNVANVILQTVKSLATVKCGKTVAALINGLAYGLYTIVLVYTNADFSLWAKVAVVAAANLVGVYIVKYFEEKMNKERLWEVRFTIPRDCGEVADMLAAASISYNSIEVQGKNDYTMYNAYCGTRAESLAVKEIIKKYGAKYFASESKVL